MQQPRIFLSHSSRDKFFVRELSVRLQRAGAKTWLDEAEINIGDSLIQKIGEAIDSTDYVAVVLSTSSIDSEWVQRELQVALNREFSSRRVTVLPILLEHVEIPPFLRDKLYADFTRPELVENSFKMLLRAVGLTHAADEPIPSSLPTSSLPRNELSVSQRRLMLFEDILIKGIDESRCSRPHPTASLYQVYLQLSASPPYEWTQIFDAERRFPRHSQWRKSWVEGDYLVVHCILSELADFLLADLKEDVHNTNLKWREYLSQLAKRELRDRECFLGNHDQISGLKQHLNLE